MIPEIVRELSLRQSARFENGAGVLFQVRVSPPARRFEVEEVVEDDE